MDIPIKRLKEHPFALKELSCCLDRNFKYLNYWSHFAFLLNVPDEIRIQCNLHSEYSPTIKLFEFLQVVQPELSVTELKDALSSIKRSDILQVILNQDFKDNDKVCEVITSSSSDIMEKKIAIELDSAIKPTSNWENLAKQLKVPYKTYKKFKMYSDYNPTISLVRYLYATSKEPIPLKVFMDYFNEMNRQDVISMAMEVLQSDEKDIVSLNAEDVFKLDSDLLTKTADLLNKDTAGAEGWRGLGRRFKIDTSILDSLEPPHDKEVHSSTTKVICWLAAARPLTTIKDLVEALDKINRCDAAKILISYFAPAVEFPYDDSAVEVVDSGPSTPRNRESFSYLQGKERNFGLPLRTTKIIGREKEKSELIDHLTKGQYHMVVLRAATGFGKTSLVIDVGHEVIKDQYCYTVVYVNSRHVFSLEGLAVEILKTCGISSGRDPISHVLSIFKSFNKNCLLIIENLHLMYRSMDQMVTPPTTSSKLKQEFIQFLRKITQFSQKLKVLITTWEPLDFPSINVRQTTLTKLSKEDSIKLLTFKSEDLPLNSDHVVNQIVECCGGIPLLLCAAVAFLIESGDVNTGSKWLSSCSPDVRLKRLSPESWPDDKRFNRCLDACFSTMHRTSKVVLFLVSVFPNRFTLKEAGRLSDDCEINQTELEQGLLALQGYCFLHYDDTTSSYFVHSAIRDFGYTKAFEVDEFKGVYEKARRSFIRNSFNALSKIEEEFYSHNCMSAIQGYRNELSNIRQIASWLIFDDRMEMEEKNYYIDSFINTLMVSIVLMPSQELKLVLCKIAQRCQHHDVKRCCECLIYGGVKNVMGCLCTPCVCYGALEWALWCFKKVDEIRSERHSEMHISEQTEAEFSIKYGRCMVRQGRKEEGLTEIKKGLKIRKKCVKESPNTKNRVLLAACYNDLAAAYSYIGNHTEAISTRWEHVIPVYQQDLGIHPFTARAQSDIAGNYLARGEYEKAMKAVETALSYQRMILGDHQETARSLFDKGRILSEQVRVADSKFTSLPSSVFQTLYERALGDLKKALEMQERVLDSPEETAKTHRELVVVLTQLGRKEEAEQHSDMIEECMRKMQKAHVDLPSVPKSKSLKLRGGVEDEFSARNAEIDRTIKQELVTPKHIEEVNYNKSRFAELKEYFEKRSRSKSEEGNSSTEEKQTKVDTFVSKEDIETDFALGPQHHVFVSDLENFMAMKHSIGAIIAVNVSGVEVKCAGTCFRIGNKYAITNNHVLGDIKKLGIQVRDCYVDFNYKEGGGDSINFASDPVFVSSKNLDYAIIELDNMCELPASVTDNGYCIAPAGRQLMGGECLTLLGHPDGQKKQTDVSCPIKHQEDIQEHLELVRSKLNEQQFKDYSLYFHGVCDNPHNVTYDVSTFFWGSSGSPGFLMHEKLLVVLHGHGIPFKGTRKHYVLEYGILMSSIVKDVKNKIDSGEIRGATLDDIFGGRTSSIFDPVAMDIA